MSLTLNVYCNVFSWAMAVIKSDSGTVLKVFEAFIK